MERRKWYIFITFSAETSDERLVYIETHLALPKTASVGKSLRLSRFEPT